jgi:aryl-alcohol dehydrogenase-like predicted oxidoreductase
MTFGNRMAPISKVDAALAEAMLDRALDTGVNLIDTADVYSAGQSEQILAPLLARYRDKLLVATKLGMAGGNQPMTRKVVMASVEDSLRRLSTDRIDVLYLHRPLRTTEIDETFDALDELVYLGRVRTVGLSNWSAGSTGFIVGRQRARDSVVPMSVQVYWSLVGRDVEQEIVPTCQQLDVGITVWSPLAGGYLTGRQDGRRSTWAFPPVDENVGLRVLRVLRHIADELGVTPARAAIAWLLGKQEIASIIIGASSLDQLNDNLDAVTLVLDADHTQALDDASAVPPIYPRWWEATMGVV